MLRRTPVLIFFLIVCQLQTYAQSCTGYVTFTQGAWGACANGNNIGNYLNANFSAAFPNGLQIGCTNTLQLNSATAVRDFLPQSTTPKALPNGILINPNSNNYKNILAGQLITLALNIGFDDYDASFAPANDQLKYLIIASGPFTNWSVEDLFNEANKKIGGCSSSTFTYSEFNDAINNININYDRGLANLNFLSCQLHLTECHQNAGCNGSNTGSINLTVHNGNPPYSYAWSNGSTTQDLSNISAGNYTVVVTDASGHTASLSVVISQPAPFNITTNSTNVSCNGNSDGSINLIINGNGGPYSTQWSNGATSNVLTNINGGNYNYTVTDANGCSQCGNVLISEPAALLVNVNATDVSCNGGNNGTINIQPIGGTSPYTINLNNNAATNLNSVLTAGSYAILVSDNNGCSLVTTTNVYEPTPLVLTGTKTDAYACDQFVCDGNARVLINGGVSPYSILWSDGTTNVDSLVNLCPMPQLNVTVTDHNGCISTYDYSGIECKVCDTLTTYTQFKWGEVPNGSNIGSYLHANFNGAFSAGLTIGCNNMLTLTNAQAITDWLPKTGLPAILPVGTLVDDINYNNIFAAQLVTAKLNVGFDAYDSSFNSSPDYLGNRFFISGLYAGYTVDQVIEEASNVIGGCVPNYLIAELNFALKAANENYEDGLHANNYLACRFIEPIRYAATNEDLLSLVSIYPNPCSDVVYADLNLSSSSDIKIEVIDLLGRLVKSIELSLDAGKQKITIDTKDLSEHVYVVRFSNGTSACNTVMMVK